MTPAGPVWPTLPILRVLCALVAVLWVPWRLQGLERPHECAWKVVLNSFDKVGEDFEDHFSEQEPLRKVSKLVTRLVDLPLDVDEVYLGFPYYLKINYSCHGKSSAILMRSGHLMGLKPLVLITFQTSVNFYRWDSELLELQMEAVPFRSKGLCDAEVVCVMSWYVPMPIRNGSVAMNVDVSSNGLGPIIPTERFQVNINGFLKRKEDTLEFTLGNELFNLVPRQFSDVPSRPLWYTLDHTPVLILGGIPEEKNILLTDTNFKDFYLVELSIDSCWVGSHYCPQTNFTATIQDTIATESTLFIRQNQLLYYFTGRYIILHEQDFSTKNWIRVLPNECIKKLCPVFLPYNASEYIMALSSGKNEGYVHFGTIQDGHVTFELIPRQRSVCEILRAAGCSITWATSAEYHMFLLVEIPNSPSRNYFQVVSYNLVSDVLTVIFTIPEFIPEVGNQEHLIIFGIQSYTTFPMTPRGMFYNPFSNLLFIWGNFLMQSFNGGSFIYLSNFPKELSIKYLVNSLHGDMVLVTENEEIWFHNEESYRIYRLFPSESWEMFASLQMIQQSTFYAPKETMLTLFYDNRKLYQLVYLEDHTRNRLVKRMVPVEQLLEYLQSSDHYVVQEKGNHLVLTFTNLCPFTEMSLQNLPDPQIYSRLEHLRALPPISLDLSGFYHKNSLAVYQGLVYYLLWLHTKYHHRSEQPYIDPVNNSTWNWWMDKIQNKDYYFYLASNMQSMGKVHLEPMTYEKVLDVKAGHSLPERIFLDKGNKYTFAIYLTPPIEFDLQKCSFQRQGHRCFLRETSIYSNLELMVKLPDLSCIDVEVSKMVLVNHNAVLFWITISDLGMCFEQGISGHHLIMSSIKLKSGIIMPVFLGCPLGKRLAFDTTRTLQHHKEKNRHYFDCLQPNPDMPCFLFRDTFYPFFLIEDMVTGDSGKFKGSYILKVVGGGPTEHTIREYSEEEIIRYNSPMDKSRSLIWIAENPNSESLPFTIMSEENSGIEWLCMENSPCYDTIPHGFSAPDFFFKVLVSNRGVDNSTYCDYQISFLLHIHGFPISARRTLFIFMGKVSASFFIGLVILYIITYLMLPLVIKGCNLIRWKINTLLASDSYFTYQSSSRVPSVSSKSVYNIPTSS